MEKIERRETTGFDWQLFDAFCANPITTFESIARMMDCSVDTLENRVRDKFDMKLSDYRTKKMEQFKTALFAEQWKTAKDGNATMQIWLGKNYLGQTDKNEISIPRGEIVLKYANEISGE